MEYSFVFEYLYSLYLEGPIVINLDMDNIFVDLFVDGVKEDGEELAEDEVDWDYESLG